MGATNHTTNYELSQFIGTDKPSWLNDYNNDMLKIDTAVKSNATAASGAQSTANTADGKADANALAIQTLNTQINTPDTGLAATVAEHTTAITGINSTIGTTPLTTTAQTLTGAIEEVKGSIPSISGLMKYTGKHSISVTPDGVKSYSQMLNELNTALLTYLSTKDTAYRFTFDSISIAGIIALFLNTVGVKDKTFNSFFTASYADLSSTGTIIQVAALTSGSFYKVYDIAAGTLSDISSTVPTSSNVLIVYIDEYELA